jgi:hypothetical protein
MAKNQQNGGYFNPTQQRTARPSHFMPSSARFRDILLKNQVEEQEHAAELVWESN